jgi:anti-sigma regulatory factor (Ser/Thr protein kinase)
VPGARYVEKSLTLNDGDTVFFYTDGITEAFDSSGNPFSDRRLREVLYPSRHLTVEALGSEIIGKVADFTGDAPQSDDIACVVLRYRKAAEPASGTGSAPEELSVRIRNDLKELVRLAAMVGAFGERNGLAKNLVHDLNLVLDELVTNTVSYGYDDDLAHDIEISLRRDGRLLTVIVEDDARYFNPLKVPEPDLAAPLEDRRVGGLGVHLVRTLMDTVDYDRLGKRNRLVMTKRI